MKIKLIYNTIMKKYITIFTFVIFIFGCCFFFYSNKKNEKIKFSHPIFFQYIHFESENSITFTSSPKSSNIPLEKEKSEKTPIKKQTKKSFFSFQGCTPASFTPNLLSRKLKKESINTEKNSTTSVFKKFDCGLIQTIIPLPF